MSNVYLALSSDRDRNLSALAGEVEPFLPFDAEARHERLSADGRAGIWAWSVLQEAARGSFWSATDDEVVTYNGWIAERGSTSIDTSVAESAAEILDEIGVDRFAREVDGDWSLLRFHCDGVIEGCCDFLGGQHLYYGTRNGVAAVSNRAMVVAAALNDGHLPAPEPLFLSWLLTSPAAPVGDLTPFKGVHLLLSDDRLIAESGRVDVDPIDATAQWSSDWSESCERFVERAAQIKKLPDLNFSLALTGGKDTRLVLAGLVAADALDSVDHAFLHSVPEHPDVIVGRQLADHYGLEFRLFEPRTASDDIHAALSRHNFQTEFSANAWDLKGCDQKPREATLHGTYGEIYRGHADLKFALGWKWVERKYLRRSYIDLADILTEEAIRYCHDGLQQYLEELRSRQIPRLHLHDTFHRHVRMQRWMGQLQLHSSCATVAMAPIPSAGLLEKYRRLSLRERQSEKTHYELMRRCDEWLVAHPFANDKWSPLLPTARLRGARPVTGSAHRLSRQMVIWQKHGETITDFLRDPSSSPFFDIVDAKRLSDLLERAGESPDFVTLRAILAAAAVRHAIDVGVETHRIALDKI